MRRISDGLGVLQVQRQAALAGVELAEVAAVAALPVVVGAQRLAQPHVVALGRFDLDHVGAQVGQQPGAVGAGQHDAEVEHAQARQGTVFGGGGVHGVMLPQPPRLNVARRAQMLCGCVLLAPTGGAP
jgi:hypothetical protein